MFLSTNKISNFPVFLKFRPLIYTLVFAAGLEAVILWHRHVLLILSALFVLALFEGKNVGKKWKFSILPPLFSVSSVALLYLVTLGYEQQILILLTSVLYYLALFGAYRLGKYEKDQTARGMITAATAATVFFTYSGAYGLYLNFLVPLYVLMLAYLIVTVFVNYQYFSIIKTDDKKTVWLYSFILALVMAELIWTMNFWPFGYLTTGVIALILYYILWDVIQSHFLNILSRKRTLANMIFFSVLVAMVLLSSKWTPTV